MSELDEEDQALIVGALIVVSVLSLGIVAVIGAVIWWVRRGPRA